VKGTITTVGHSNHEPDVFVRLLKSAGIELVVDIRSQPYSAYSPQFGSRALKRFLEESHIGYRHEPALGGRPDDPAMYDSAGHVLYGRIAISESFLAAIVRLEGLADCTQVAIMCSEENPDECHRRLLVARVLERRGDRVRHLRGDGTMQTEDELPATLAAREGLFEGGEFSTWRSIRSVSRRSPPRSSSEL
jgi:uncharacterized protein (DUF488 family)